MANSNKLVSTLKIDINSVLVSAGAEITLRQLEVDYCVIIGSAIPYREAGHTSVEELVLSMPDAVITRWWNGELKLRAVTNLGNEQLVKFVGLAKNKPKTSYRPNKKSLPARYQQSLLSNMSTQNNTRQHPLLSNMTTQNNTHQQPLLSSMTTGNNTPQQPLLSTMTTRNDMASVKTTNLTKAGSNADYNMLRGEILNLMLGYRYGLPGSKFAEAFAKRYGNYRKLSDSGFPSILVMLQSMPDVVDIEFNENNTDFTVRGKRGQKKPSGK